MSCVSDNIIYGTLHRHTAGGLPFNVLYVRASSHFGGDAYEERYDEGIC